MRTKKISCGHLDFSPSRLLPPSSELSFQIPLPKKLRVWLDFPPRFSDSPTVNKLREYQRPPPKFPPNSSLYRVLSTYRRKSQLSRWEVARKQSPCQHNRHKSRRQDSRDLKQVRRLAAKFDECPPEKLIPYVCRKLP